MADFELLLMSVTLVAFRGVTGSLLAPDLIPYSSKGPYQAYFTEGQSTAEALYALPICIISNRAGAFLELYNINTGMVVGHHGPFDNTHGADPSWTITEWDNVAHPWLNSSYNGLYYCRTDSYSGHEQRNSYQLNVRAKLRVSCPAKIRIDVGKTRSVPIHVSHSLPVTLKASTVAGTSTVMSQNDQGTEYSWRIAGNDPNLIIGQPVSVTWTATYVNTECSGVWTKEWVRKKCEAISTSASCATKVLADNRPLSAPYLLPNTEYGPYSAYFADGQSTFNIVFALPKCEVLQRAGAFLETYNSNTGLVVAAHGTFPTHAAALWNTTAHPVLNSSYNGLYYCRTDSYSGHDPRNSYQLNVRTTLKVSCPKSIAIGGEETLNVSIHVSHSLPVILNASTVVGTHIITSKDQGTEYMWKIRGNDPNLVFNHPVSVTWTATYINTECSGVEYAPLAKKACEAISASASCTTNVLADGPSLLAPDLYPAIPHGPYSAYFADGQSAVDVLSALPACAVLRRDGAFMELYNSNTGLVIGRHGPFDNTQVTFIYWDVDAYGVLNSSFNGLYYCRTDSYSAHEPRNSYQLNVRANLKVSCPRNIAIGGYETRNVSVHVSHSLPVTVTASPVVGSSIIMSRNNKDTEYVWRIRGNDQSLVLGQPVPVTWTATYISTECSGAFSAPLAKEACEAISTSASCTTNVLADDRAIPLLSAPDLRPAIPHGPYSAYFADGQSAADVFSALPVCEVSRRDGAFLEIYNSNTGLVVRRHGPFNNTQVALIHWDIGAYGVLNSSFNGLYYCRTDSYSAHEPRNSYQLTVLATLEVSCPANVRIGVGETRNVPVRVSHSLPVTMKANPAIGTRIKMSRSDQGTEYIWKIGGKDQKPTFGQPISVTWTATYVNTECSGVVAAPSAKKACEAISTSSCTTTLDVFGGNDALMESESPTAAGTTELAIASSPNFHPQQEIPVVAKASSTPQGSDFIVPSISVSEASQNMRSFLISRKRKKRTTESLSVHKQGQS